MTARSKKGTTTMKKIISAVLVCVLLVGCIFALASCAKTLNGTYKTGSGVLGSSYTFKGSDVTITYYLLGTETVLHGTYVISEDEEKGQIITITIAADDAEADDADKYEGVHTLVEGTEGDTKYIKIDGVQYTKVEE